MKQHFDFARSLLASSASLWRGTFAQTNGSTPVRKLELYDMENCPYCRLVREAITALNLDVLILPCPKGGTRYRPRAEALGGKQQFPLLIDHNSGVKLYESADIIHYLHKTYGSGKAPQAWRIHTIDKPSAFLASSLRGLRGVRVDANRPALQPLHLWSFESSPYARPVRERLCELELPYVVHNIGKAQWQDFMLPQQRARWMPDMDFKNPARRALKQRAGRVASPYLADPNRGEELFESQDILAYLNQHYAL
ncbi:glutathione S-transferase, N-terminal domain [gamma proteobacterium HTCC5015]|nr:glutathione S-transferase, N-terminal domain [gamma proteobacterium HTCC5015]